MVSVYDGPAGPFPYRVEVWEPHGRTVLVLGATLAPRPAIAAFLALLEEKPERDLRLRHEPGGRMIERGEYNFAIEEWNDRGGVAVLHGLFMGLPARPAFDAAEPSVPGRELTLRHGGRLLKSRGPG